VDTELPGFDVDGPLPDFDPVVSDNLISKGRASVRQFAKNPVERANEWRDRAADGKLSAREVVIEVTGRQSFVGSAGTVATEINERVQGDAADGYILVRTSPPTAWRLSSTRWCRCSRSAASSGPTTPAQRCGITSAWPRSAGRTKRTAATSAPPGPPHEVHHHHPDRAHTGPVHRSQKSTRDRFREALDSALLAEELGFDGFGVGNGTNGHSSPRRRPSCSAISQP